MTASDRLEGGHRHSVVADPADTGRADVSEVFVIIGEAQVAGIPGAVLLEIDDKVISAAALHDIFQVHGEGEVGLSHCHQSSIVITGVRTARWGGAYAKVRPLGKGARGWLVKGNIDLQDISALQGRAAGEEGEAYGSAQGDALVYDAA